MRARDSFVVCAGNGAGGRTERMAIAEFRLFCFLGTTALALSLPACVPSSFVQTPSPTNEPTPTPKQLPAPPLGERASPSSPPRADTPRSPTPEPFGDATPDFWDRLGVDVDLAQDDFRQF